jgi:hypothetical protein
MTIEQLQRLHQARPFRPFTLKLADGNRIRVRSPEFLSHSPTGRTAVVFGGDDSFEVVDLLLVASIEVGDVRARRNGRPRGNGRKK